MPETRRALLSLTDKTGAADFARGLASLGFELVSTGGTARLLRDAGLAVKDVSELTGFPEMLDGRVKTLHPRVHAGVLAIRANAEHMKALAEHGIGTIDVVVVNLYDFAAVAAKADAKLEDLVENIDIGGPSMIRGAAKNWQDVAVVTDPADYPAILDELRAGGAVSRETKWKLMKKAFALTARYDAAIATRLEQVDSEEPLPAELRLVLPRKMTLRYGENPHQAAALYASGHAGVAGGEQLHGKELSYNNLVDLDAAWQLILEFDRPAAAIIKHTNPCGCAEQTSLAEAYRKALEADPISAFGGVLAFNREVDEETAGEVAKLFVEAIAAPAFSAQALAVLSAKKNLRLVRVTPSPAAEPVLKSISGGMLAQTADIGRLQRAEAKVVTKRAPSEAEWAALEFGWKVCKHVKSNAIVYAKPGQILSTGAGQMSRVDSVKVGAMKAVLPLEGCVVASDAFFPFPDGLEQAAEHGATAFIQPGGSVKDGDVIAAADRLDLAMVFTGVRHFRH
jgi:phosphoribosylaminoimidazolecarboxamide formyltransferase / IMP cyclohydrolase